MKRRVLTILVSLVAGVVLVGCYHTTHHGDAKVVYNWHTKEEWLVLPWLPLDTPHTAVLQVRDLKAPILPTYVEILPPIERLLPGEPLPEWPWFDAVVSIDITKPDGKPLYSGTYRLRDLPLRWGGMHHGDFWMHKSAAQLAFMTRAEGIAIDKVDSYDVLVTVDVPSSRRKDKLRLAGRALHNQKRHWFRQLWP